MAEPTLTLKLSDLLSEVGFNLGFGRGVSPDPVWDTRTQTTLDYIVKSGLRQFYYPPALPGQQAPYSWSFLKPTAQLQLFQGTTTLELPDDYGGLDGQLTVTANSTTAQPWLVLWENESRIRQRYAMNPTVQGPPIAVAEQWLKGTSPQHGQRAHLFVFPEADQDYQVLVPYYVNPDYLTSSLPYAYGGPQHSETILQSCLTVAEERLDDIPRQQGTHWAAFMERLTASIGMDQKSKPQRLGQNLDRSDLIGWDRRDLHWWNTPLGQYNGTSLG